MTRLDELKVMLIKQHRTRSISDAVDICEWLYKRIVKEPRKIEVKEG